MTDDRPWLPCAVAEWFGVTEVTVRRWVRDGKLQRIDVGTLRITARSVRELSQGYDPLDGEGQRTMDSYPDHGLPGGPQALAQGNHCVLVDARDGSVVLTDVEAERMAHSLLRRVAYSRESQS
jgi:hypothetical protein